MIEQVEAWHRAVAFGQWDDRVLRAGDGLAALAKALNEEVRMLRKQVADLQAAQGELLEAIAA